MSLIVQDLRLHIDDSSSEFGESEDLVIVRQTHYKKLVAVRATQNQDLFSLNLEVDWVDVACDVRCDFDDLG